MRVKIRTRWSRRVTNLPSSLKQRKVALRMRLIWEDEEGEIDFDEDKMIQWFSMAIANLKHYDIAEDECAWMLFLMGAETAIRGNRGDEPDSKRDS